MRSEQSSITLQCPQLGGERRGKGKNKKTAAEKKEEQDRKCLASARVSTGEWRVLFHHFPPKVDDTRWYWLIGKQFEICKNDPSLEPFANVMKCLHNKEYYDGDIKSLPLPSKDQTCLTQLQQHTKQYQTPPPKLTVSSALPPKPLSLLTPTKQNCSIIVKTQLSIIAPKREINPCFTADEPALKKQKVSQPATAPIMENEHGNVWDNRIQDEQWNVLPLQIPKQINDNQEARQILTKHYGYLSHSATIPIKLLVQEPTCLTQDRFEKDGFDFPFIIREQTHEQFDMHFCEKEKDFNFDTVLKFVDGSQQYDCINVITGDKQSTSLNKIVEYFITPPVDRCEILNMLGMEFSVDKKLKEQLKRPRVVRENDLIDEVFNKDDEKTHSQLLELFEEFPTLRSQRYLMYSSANSFTDFHIDFSGSSVWIYVKTGCKYFFVIPYESRWIDRWYEWEKQSTQDGQTRTFFPEFIQTNCYLFVVGAGHTVMLPSGWIHAVYTPTDSIAVGGNFLHRMSLKTEIYCYEQEIKNFELISQESCVITEFKDIMAFTLLYYVTKIRQTLSSILLYRKILDEFVEEIQNSTCHPDQQLQMLDERLLQVSITKKQSDLFDKFHEYGSVTDENGIGDDHCLEHNLPFLTTKEVSNIATLLKTLLRWHNTNHKCFKIFESKHNLQQLVHEVSRLFAHHPHLGTYSKQYQKKESFMCYYQAGKEMEKLVNKTNTTMSSQLPSPSRFDSDSESPDDTKDPDYDPNEKPKKRRKGTNKKKKNTRRKGTNKKKKNTRRKGTNKKKKQ